MKLLTNFENPFSKPLQRPYNGDVDPKNAYRKPHVILWNHTESLKTYHKEENSEEGFSKNF